MHIMKYIPITVALLALCLSARSEETAATKQLKERTRALLPTITQVSKSVYCASGYSPSNISMIVGTDGIVIVDTGMFPDDARAVMKEFRKVTQLPVMGVILTHGHGDHTGGLRAFMEVGANGSKPTVYGRSPFNTEGDAFKSAGLTINGLRGARQGGFLLPPEKRINNGIAQAVYPPSKDRNVFESGAVQLTDTFGDGRKKIAVAGLELELVAAPGETSDELYVWFPAERVVFTGDNFYRSWPNIYAIRGAAYRDVLEWIHSLDMMLAEKPAHAVPGHTLPLVGEAATMEVLGNYRKAIRYVFDATIAGMNKGMTPDELVQTVKLPPELASQDYLLEFYGNVEWAVRSIFSGTLGRFDGNPTHLFSLPPSEEAKRMAELAGGVEQLQERARKALEAGDAQWCAQLSDHLIALDPKSKVAKLLKAEALEVLADHLLTATGRNYYLTVAQQLRADNGE